MAAGQGFKTFATGDVLTAADTNGYLMQGVLVFANATARDAAITSPQEGQTCYLKDTDQIYTYSGAAWVSQAGISAGLIDAKGDLIVGSAADTAARLAVGTNDYVLTADSTATNGIAWKAAGGAGANWSAVNAGGTSLSGTATTISGISGKDKIMVCIVGASLSSNVSPYLEVRMNGTSTVYYTGGVAEYDGSSITIANSSNWTGTISGIQLNQFASNSAATLGGSVTINGCNGTNYKQFISTGGCYRGSTSFASILNTQGYIENTSTLSSITITTSTGTPSFDAGTVYIFASA